MSYEIHSSYYSEVSTGLSAVKCFNIICALGDWTEKLVVYRCNRCHLLALSFVGSRPSDHYFRSVCLFVCLFVCAVFLSRL